MIPKVIIPIRHYDTECDSDCPFFKWIAGKQYCSLFNCVLDHGEVDTALRDQGCIASEKELIALRAMKGRKKTENPIKVDPDCSLPVLICPVCDLQRVHMVGLECRPPGTPKGILSVDTDGISIDPRPEPLGRGVKITLKFCCESGHRFDYDFSFHKGSTAINEMIVSAKDIYTEDDSIENFPRVIWRD